MAAVRQKFHLRPLFKFAEPPLLTVPSGAIKANLPIAPSIGAIKARLSSRRRATMAKEFRSFIAKSMRCIFQLRQKSVAAQTVKTPIMVS